VGFVLVLATAVDSYALSARVRWLPGGGGAVEGYDLLVRPMGQPYAAVMDAGLPTPSADGVLSYVVANLTDGVIYFFTVTARGADGSRSPCAGELVLGEPDACLIDRCCPGDACTTGSAPDGTPCDGADACRTCRAAACAATSESPLDTRRLRLANRAAGTRINASGSFTPASALDPAVDGLTLSVVDASGVVVQSAFVPPDALRVNAAGTSFVLLRERRDDTLQMIAVRVRRGEARVRARLTGGVETTSAPLGWVVASGQGCARSPTLACTTTPRGLSCR